MDIKYGFYHSDYGNLFIILLKCCKEYADNKEYVCLVKTCCGYECGVIDEETLKDNFKYIGHRRHCGFFEKIKLIYNVIKLK